ncbi:hypothetical protein TNCV_4808541 [Trichonephila clavipes]|nr:hypothetical protein TNCV_4808541 [Trichonephila clavipes]
MSHYERGHSIDLKRVVGQIEESLGIRVEAAQRLDDDVQNVSTIIDFSVRTVAIDTRPQQSGNTERSSEQLSQHQILHYQLAGAVSKLMLLNMTLHR